MTNSTIAADRPLRPTTLQAVTMVAGPALLLAGFALHPADDGSPETVLATIAEHHDGWVAAHLLIFVAAVLLIPAALTLGRLARGRQPRVAAVGAGLVVFASVGLASAAAFEQLIGVAATLDGEAAAMARLIEAAESSIAVSMMLYPPMLAVVIGFLVLAWALHAARAIPRWAAIAMALGAVGVMVPEPGRCVGTALLLTTFVAALRRSRRSEAVGDPQASARRPVTVS